MGWNSWNPIRCEGLNEKAIFEIADAIISSGLRDVGYNYVNIDDCWMAPQRSAEGHLQAHPQRFPNGMKAVGDYLHSKGLKFGIYSCAGHTTCEGWPASFGNERIDAADWAAWGVDYLKYDFCGLEKVPADQKQPEKLYSVMRDALNATGRQIMFSLCNWGVGQPHLWGHKVGNSWRTGRDVFAVWDEHSARKVHKLPGFLQSIMTAVEDAERSRRTVDGPGGFNDPDMLVVGLDGMTPYGIVEECPTHLPQGSCKPGDYVSRQQWGMVGGLTYTEQRTHFAFWCMLASPLMLGNDPRHMSRATMRLLTAPGLLAINQDPSGRSGHRVWRDGALQIWRKELADGSHALLLFNGGNVTSDITVRWQRDLPDASRAHEASVPREPGCRDDPDVKECAMWAKGGECVKNPGFMKSHCLKSCDACPPAIYEGRQATGRVRDGWEDEDLGAFVALYTAKHVEPHEARVLTVRFGLPTADLRPHLEVHSAASRAHGAGDPVRTGHGLPPHEQQLLHEQHHSDHHGAIPTLGACASEHADSILLVALGMAAGCTLLVLCLYKLLTREAVRTRAWKAGQTSPRTPWQRDKFDHQREPKSHAI